jgi:hypothetical protein
MYELNKIIFKKSNMKLFCFTDAQFTLVCHHSVLWFLIQATLAVRNHSVHYQVARHCHQYLELPPHHHTHSRSFLLALMLSSTATANHNQDRWSPVVEVWCLIHHQIMFPGLSTIFFSHFLNFIMIWHKKL